MKEFLIKDIQKIGLFIDNRGNLYGEKYKEYLNTKTGVWQHPEELAEFCLFLDGYDINSFLNIGDDLGKDCKRTSYNDRRAH